MKRISDIRLFKSEFKNEYGDYITYSFGNKKLNAIIKRIVMKLRENDFAFGEFDHLYINLTICDVEGKINLSNKVDSYHQWYRYCDANIDNEIFNK